MEKIYAQLDDSGVCIGICQLSGPVEDVRYIEISSLDPSYLRRVHRSGKWTEDRVELFEKESAPMNVIDAKIEAAVKVAITDQMQSLGDKLDQVLVGIAMIKEQTVTIKGEALLADLG